MTAMTQQAGEVGESGLWVEYFEQNNAVHAKTDAAIDYAEVATQSVIV